MARRITAAVAHDETAPIRLISEHIPEDSGIEVGEEFTTFELNADAILRAGRGSAARGVQGRFRIGP